MDSENTQHQSLGKIPKANHGICRGHFRNTGSVHSETREKQFFYEFCLRNLFETSRR